MSLLRAHKSVFEIVRDALSANSQTSHIKVSVGARFQGEQNPEVIIQQSSFDINDLNTADYGSFEISVLCYSNTYTEAANIADIVFTAVQSNNLYTLTETEPIEGTDPQEYNISETVYHIKGLDLFLEHYDEDGYEANVLIRATEAQDTTTGVGGEPSTGGSPTPYYPQSDYRIQDLADTNVASLAEGHILKYDFSEGEWVNATLPLLVSNGLTQSSVNGYTVVSLADSVAFESASTSQDFTIGGNLNFAGANTKLIRPLNTGAAAGPLTIQSNGDLVIELDQNADEPDKALIVKNGADAEVFKVDESGVVVVGKGFKIEKPSNNDYDYRGDVVYFGSTTGMTQGDLYYFSSSGSWVQADANAVTSSGSVLLAIALGASSDTDGMLIRGTFTMEATAIDGTEVTGDELYVGTTAGHLSSDVSSYTTGDVVRVVGYCLDGTNGQIWFNPSNDFITLA